MHARTQDCTIKYSVAADSGEHHCLREHVEGGTR